MCAPWQLLAAGVTARGDHQSARAIIDNVLAAGAGLGASCQLAGGALPRRVAHLVAAVRATSERLAAHKPALEAAMLAAGQLARHGAAAAAHSGDQAARGAGIHVANGCAGVPA